MQSSHSLATASLEDGNIKDTQLPVANDSQVEKLSV